MLYLEKVTILKMNLSKFQREKCLQLIDKLISWEICQPFRELIDPVRDGAPNYFEVIKEPMSLNEVKKRLMNSQYPDLKTFIHDVNLIWDNARKYNGDDTIFAMMAKEAQSYFNRKMNNFPSSVEEDWLMKVRKIANEFHEAITHPPHDIDPKKQREIIAEATATQTNVV